MLYDVIVIGGGAAGLGAALYSARYTLKTLVIAKEFGGTGNIAHKVDNWIGDPGITGPELMNKFVKHVDEYKVPRVEASVISIEKNSDGTFTIKTDEKETYKAKAVIYALGMKHSELGVPGEKEYSGKGVHYCYTCDGPLYGRKKVAVVGGGDAAGLGALFMADYADSVDVFVRKDAMRAEPITQEQMRKHKKIKINYKKEIAEFFGERFLKGVKLKSGETVELDGVFIEIGHLPISGIAKKLRIKLNSHGFIEVDKHQKTNIKGFVAAGDITTKHTLKQFITSAEEGSVAAETVYNYVNQNKW